MSLVGTTSPTRAEISTMFGFRSPNAAEEHLRALERKGAIGISSGIARGIQLAEQIAGTMQSIIALPLIGRVAAGSPILAEQNVEKNVPVDPTMFKPKADYLLKVRGESMRDIGILDGDLLAVHAQPEARSGQVVVARLGNEVTVKRFVRKDGRIELVAENPEFKPIVVDPRRDEFVIEGLAVGIIRTGSL